MHCASRAPPYVVDKIKMRSKTYGIKFVVIINYVTTWATSDHLA
jgi:hypothetical protein